MRTATAALLLCLPLISLPLTGQITRPFDTFPTSAGPVKITPIMHATVLLQPHGKNIYIDPAQGAHDGMPPADLILTTDIHGDHMSRGPSPGQLFHDKGRGNGYIMTYGRKRFYFSGHTEAIPEMEALKKH